MPRAQNAHAYVNAGFLFKINVSDSGKVLTKPTIVFGGINPEFVSIITNTSGNYKTKNLKP
jgi:xanthine dehydrogenase/oxidase